MDATNHSVVIVMVRVFVFMVGSYIIVKHAAPRHPMPSVSVVSKSIHALNATLPHLTSVSVVSKSINALNATLPHLSSVSCVVLVSGSTKADALTVSKCKWYIEVEVCSYCTYYASLNLNRG